MGSLPDFVKYPRTPHLGEVPEIIGSDSLEVYEKLDGGNCQIRMHEGRLFCGNRSKFLIREGGFRLDWFRDFHRWTMSNYSLYNLSEDTVFFGEFLSYHTIPYDSEFQNRFFFIDAYDLGEERFIPYQDSRRTLLDDLQIQDVLFLDPLAKGKVSMNHLRSLAVDDSPYTSYGREGIVVKDYTIQKFAKLWRTSVKSSSSGLAEEIKKTILGMRSSGDRLDFDEEVSSGLVVRVFDELSRSGRKDISVTEIRSMIEGAINGLNR
ncbi:MAG: RNA ligase family protein [Nanoarchaeota archaeon]|nr:RNA ligase family protein [Nanoarchaeota archaeon]